MRVANASLLGAVGSCLAPVFADAMSAAAPQPTFAATPLAHDDGGISTPVLAGAGESNLAGRVEGLGFTCRTVAATPAAFVRCDGTIASFDGVPLDTTISLPPEAAELLPAVLHVIGWGGGRFVIDDTGCGPRPDALELLAIVRDDGQLPG